MKTETIQEFMLRGGKLEVLPAQKVVYKQFCKAKTAYAIGRIRMRNDPRNSGYVLQSNLFKNKVV